jgi:propanol-preferring alcohol dehydrogenase
VRADYAHPLPSAISDLEAAPLLCAGAIGYRSLRLAATQDGQCVGLMGFGASAHLVIQMIRYRYPSSPVFVFSRGEPERELARALGAAWTGGLDGIPPDQMHAIIDTTPAWTPVARGLRHLRPGGRLVINAIRKEDLDRHILSELDYPSQLWLEKEIKTVANVTRRDVREFLALAAEAGISPEVHAFNLVEANEALVTLKQGNARGATVLQV